MPKRQIPERFKTMAERLGVGVQHFIKDYAIRDDYLGQHKRGVMLLSDDEVEYLENRVLGKVQ